MAFPTEYPIDSFRDLFFSGFEVFNGCFFFPFITKISCLFGLMPRFKRCLDSRGATCNFQRRRRAHVQNEPRQFR